MPFRFSESDIGIKYMKRYFYIISLLIITFSILSYFFFVGKNSLLYTEEERSYIPLSALYQASETSERGFIPSFDGSIIASFMEEGAKKTIRLRRRSEKSSYEEIDASEISDFNWHPFLNALVVNKNGRLWQIPAETTRLEKWIDVTPRGFLNASILRWPKDASGELVVSSTDRNPAFSDLYTLRTDGSGKTLLEENEGNTFGWWFNADLNPVVRLDELPNGNRRVLHRRPNEEEWKPVLDIEKRDDFEILRPQNIDTELYALSNRGRDTIALVRVNLADGLEEVIARDEDVDIVSAFFLNKSKNLPDLVTYPKNGYPFIEPLTPEGNRLKNLVDTRERQPGGGVIGQSADGRILTIAEQNSAEALTFFLLDVQSGTKEELGSTPLKKWARYLSPMIPKTIHARDGLKLPAFLTLPKNRPPEKLPAVVMIHGGPASHYRYGFDADVQMLANRGYAVLQVNFRGSTGYGKAFRAAGYGEAGRAMQDDIVDAAKWLVENGTADPNRMAVMGGSYGGYSAALAMTRDPGLFKAAIVESAVLDLRYQMQNNPFSWALGRDELERYFGNPDDEAELEEMWRRSPLTQASRTEGAILLMAGKRDTVVGFEQSEAFERALKQAGKSVQALYHEDEAHSVIDPEALLKRARAIESFLAEQLGGDVEKPASPTRFPGWFN
ncbi:S9 family peptidase [Nitratireductor sp. B36]|uniref:alpha/beta hydrolase family protein n=1 Tax=Nitratireductor sp. B36 TaxID=2762059 RepID=UPI001E5EE305|nr:S9 family peptidase [Nitratireductor sp. B36]MCC5781190.1 S9 family peptidase [Nitratireductor sp. B36]